MSKQIKNVVRITMVGALGRMGQRIIALSEANPQVQIVAGVEQPKSPYLGNFIADGKAPIVGHIDEVLHNTDVVVDFSVADSVLKNATAVAKARKALVIGTTGLKPPVIKQIKKLAKRIPIVFSPNMSVGVNMLFQLVAQAAQSLADYDIEIVEAHHNQKKDAPSGTALRLAEIAAASSGRSEKDFVYGRKGLIGARKKKEIAIMSLRAGDIVGDHTVYLSTPGERLELTHRAQSRDAFASGALKAAIWLKKRKPGLYSMLDVLK